MAAFRGRGGQPIRFVTRIGDIKRRELWRSRTFRPDGRCLGTPRDPLLLRVRLGLLGERYVVTVVQFVRGLEMEGLIGGEVASPEVIMLYVMEKKTGLN